MIRPILAALYRLNRNRRVVRAVSFGLHLGFRCLPPILWDRLEWAQRFERRAEGASRRELDGDMRRLFGDGTDGLYLPWRVTDILGMTERRFTPEGFVWHAQRKAEKWWSRAKVRADRAGVALNLEVRRVY